MYIFFVYFVIGRDRSWVMRWIYWCKLLDWEFVLLYIMGYKEWKFVQCLLLGIFILIFKDGSYYFDFYDCKGIMSFVLYIYFLVNLSLYIVYN